MALAVVVAAAAPAAMSAPTAPPATSPDRSDVARMLSLTNDLRETVGLPPLILDAPATGVAAGWAQRLAQVGTLSHNPDLVAEMPVGWAKIGENVGMGGDVESIHKALVRSPTHYDNLVQPGFTRVGIAVVPKDGLIYAVQDFVRYASDPIPPALVEPPSARATTTSTTSTTTTTLPGGAPPVTAADPAAGVVAPGPAPQLDAVSAGEEPVPTVPADEAGRFGFVLAQLRAWDRRR